MTFFDWRRFGIILFRAGFRDRDTRAFGARWAALHLSGGHFMLEAQWDSGDPDENLPPYTRYRYSTDLGLVRFSLKFKR